MTRDRFPPGVADKIGWYVYRLIDARNGETFYVGKGEGDRVFAHAAGVSGSAAADPAEDGVDLKINRIRAIRNAGLEVTHVIHQHNIPDEAMAYRIEAAVIECYPGLSILHKLLDATPAQLKRIERVIEGLIED